MDIIAFRLPGEPDFHIYEARKKDNIDFNPSEISFIIAPFFPADKGVEYRLTTSLDSIPSGIISDNYQSFPFEEFSKSQYAEYIEEIKKNISGRTDYKIVASRRSKLPSLVNADRLFKKLCRVYPDAFVFFISTSEFGSWIGASPELLLKRKGNVLESMSLAGTRKRGETGDWDIKNSLEQQIVTDLILSVFNKYCSESKRKERITVKAGNIEHLMTPIAGHCDKDINLLSLLFDLSPTPALAGFPREDALKVIQHFEGDRVLYGGFLGPVYPEGDFRLNVILRCAYLQPDSVVLFAGGGITSLSNPSSEWDETENKMATLKIVMIFDDDK